ncbi:math domain and coiled-coil domain-containing protein at3g58220 [Phtheirospermum japonicum]|uniref:Math domain and coiled-coil domain-containing protein at3g58220 n=1 Tax=Phtheirospermum japonicum TaxID=374723 RepID=A0A830BDP7_9LAMI|nr:math domain and coiled-coil domain-containing protein at3g58220 [Phtheirospermum japonicum]
METREASPAHLLIKIESFSLLEKHGIEKYKTREFESGEYKWRLIIYPNGHDYVSVYLAIIDTSALPANWEVNASFSICLFNHTPKNK